MTPDKVETRIGTLEFFDGLPSDEAVEKVYDNLDFMRGIEAFLNFIPAKSIEGIRRGMVEMEATRSHQVVIMDRVMDSNPLFLTANTDTVYASLILDLDRDGPTVVKNPPGSSMTEYPAACPLMTSLFASIGRGVEGPPGWTIPISPSIRSPVAHRRPMSVVFPWSRLWLKLPPESMIQNPPAVLAILFAKRFSSIVILVARQHDAPPPP